MRQSGSRNKLITIDYDVIGDLAGIAGDTAKQYAHRGEYDPRNLDSVLRWVNARRAKKGLRLIGLSSEKMPAARSVSPMLFTPAPQNRILYYDPVRGCYRTDDLTDSMAFRR